MPAHQICSKSHILDATKSYRKGQKLGVIDDLTMLPSTNYNTRPSSPSLPRTCPHGKQRCLVLGNTDAKKCSEPQPQMETNIGDFSKFSPGKFTLVNCE